MSLVRCADNEAREPSGEAWQPSALQMPLLWWDVEQETSPCHTQKVGLLIQNPNHQMQCMGMKTLLIVIMVLLSAAGYATAQSPQHDRNWTGIVVHHSESGPNTTRDDIDQWHRERGWSEIGYHYVIEWDGTVRSGRPLTKVGAHAKSGKPYSRNGTHIGICLVGRDQFTEAQLTSLKTLCYMLAEDFDIQSVERHHEQCPGPGIDVEALNTAIQKARAW